MNNEMSTALFLALQRKKSADDIRPLVNEESASTPDMYFNLKPLFWALNYGAELSVVELLVDAHRDALNDVDPTRKFGVLHYVEKLGADVIKYLIENCPAAVNTQDCCGKLPLHWAAEHDVHVDIAKMLLEANKESALQQDYYGRIPFKLALDNSVGHALMEALKEANPEGSLALPAPKTEAALPPLPYGLLFPGQGSQYVKMLAEAKDLPAVKKMLKEAEEILGYDLLEVCLNGPEEKLQDTLYCQPAMYVAGLAALEKLRLEKPEAVKRAQGVAGLSLGEYTALTVAGVFTFRDGLSLVQKRAEAMQAAANLRPQAMLSVAGLNESQVVALCKDAREKAGKDEVCQISNFLFHRGFTIGGTLKAVEECKTLMEGAKALQARMIKASGGFHTELMAPVQTKLEEALMETLPRMNKPRCKVFMNIDAKPVDADTELETIVQHLAAQLTNPVRWQQCIESMMQDRITTFYECGPMKQLKAMMKRIDNDAWSNTKNVEV